MISIYELNTQLFNQNNFILIKLKIKLLKKDSDIKVCQINVPDCIDLFKERNFLLPRDITLNLNKTQSHTWF